MKSILFWLSFIVLPMSLFSQERNDHYIVVPQEEYIVYTLDKNFYTGRIINKSKYELELLSAKGDTAFIEMWNYNYRKKLSDIVLLDNGKYHKNKLIFINFDYGLDVLSGNRSSALFFKLGFRYSPKVQWGIGYGVTSFVTEGIGKIEIGQNFRNLFFFGKYNLNQNASRIFVDLGIGVAKSTNSWSRRSYTGGIFMNPGIGIDFASYGKTKVYIKLSQYIQSTSGTLRLCCDDFEYNYKHILNRTQLTFGINI